MKPDIEPANKLIFSKTHLYRFNPYDLTNQKKIGQGGFNQVYKYVHQPSGIEMAVKLTELITSEHDIRLSRKEYRVKNKEKRMDMIKESEAMKYVIDNENIVKI